MNPSLSHSSSAPLARSNIIDHEIAHRITVCWGAILAGVSAALALQVLFMMLGAGLGLAIYSPATEDNPVANLSVGALIIHSVCAIIALFLGGCVAGRFSPIHARDTGWLHGFIVWCAATVGGVILVTLGATAMLGGISKVVGGGFSAVGESVSAVAGEAADALEQSGETIASFVDEAVGNLSEDRPASEGIRAKREIAMALGRLFNPAQEGNTAANRAAAVNALVNNTGMSQDEADRTVTEWTDTFERMKADLAELTNAAATKAREAADATASALAKFSLWSFFGFLLGAAAATWGGLLGAKCATQCEETSDHARYVRDTSDVPKRQMSDSAN